MAKAQFGDTVEVHYTGMRQDGEIFDSSFDRQPLQFTIGKGQVIAGFEAAVTGMAVGETRDVTIPYSQAYGPRSEKLVITLDRHQLPEALQPEVGQQLAVHQADGQVLPAWITELTASSVTLDGNHPLAGQDLTFHVQLVSIR